MQSKVLNFSSAYFDVRNVTDITKPFPLPERCIVVNISASSAVIRPETEEFTFKLAPFTSTILRNVHVVTAQSLVVIKSQHADNISKIATDASWNHLSDLSPAFSRDVPLFKSTQDTSPRLVKINTSALLNCDSAVGGEREFEVKLNIWFAPEGTDCGIHNHETDTFLELHTQLYGEGFMQKFTSAQISSMFEENELKPGQTHHFYAIKPRDDGGFHYPWHQYHARSDCIWMAIELHPKD